MAQVDILTTEDLEASPTNGETTKAPQSDWAYDHSVDLDAHMDDIFRVVRTVNYHVSPLVTCANLSLQASLTANRLYAVPYPIVRTRTPGVIAIQVAVADAVNVNLRIGIYNDGGNALPTTRLTNGGTVSVATTGVKTVAYTTQLTKGLYWIAFIADGTPSIFATPSTTNAICLLGRSDALNTQYTSYYYTGAYGDLPDPFPTPTGYVYDIFAVGFTFSSND